MARYIVASPPLQTPFKGFSMGVLPGMPHVAFRNGKRAQRLSSLVGRFARIDSRFACFSANRSSLRKKKKKLFFFLRTSLPEMDSSEDCTRIMGISMRIGEKVRCAGIWPSASKIRFFLRMDPRESAKRLCANRLPTKLSSFTQHHIPLGSNLLHDYLLTLWFWVSLPIM